MLAGAGLVLALVASTLAARWLLARGIPEPRDWIDELRRRPTLAQVEELVAAKTATLRADFNAIAESVDSNLDAIDRTRRRVAARRQDPAGGAPPPPQAPPISAAALAFLGRGH